MNKLLHFEQVYSLNILRAVYYFGFGIAYTELNQMVNTKSVFLPKELNFMRLGAFKDKKFQQVYYNSTNH